jgi:hypothetical protein
LGRNCHPRARFGRVALVAGVLFSASLFGSAAAQAATFAFSTGSPDGKIAMASRPDSSNKPEIEAADDFVLSAQTAITHATFTGLLPTSGSVQDVTVEIYRVFPFDSSTSRTPLVPTRANSPSDFDFQSRDSNSHGQLSYSVQVLNSSFPAANSVLNGIHPSPNQTTGGEGPVTGQEVTFSVTLRNPFVLPPGHYFFVPQVQVSGPASANFYWLSAPHPVASPGTPFATGVPDLQAWIRNSTLEPDWLRVGTDIVGGSVPPLYNAAFTLDNAPLPLQSTTQSLPRGIGVRLSVRAPSAGTVQARDPQVGKKGKNGHKSAWFNTITVRVKHGGIVHLTVVPNGTGRKHISRRPLHLIVGLTFTSSGGQPSKRNIAITWRSK